MVRLHSTLVTIMATALGAMLMLPISEAEAGAVVAARYCRWNIR